MQYTADQAIYNIFCYFLKAKDQCNTTQCFRSISRNTKLMDLVLLFGRINRQVLSIGISRTEKMNKNFKNVPFLVNAGKKIPFFGATYEFEWFYVIHEIESKIQTFHFMKETSQNKSEHFIFHKNITKKPDYFNLKLIFTVLIGKFNLETDA